MERMAADLRVHFDFNGHDGLNPGLLDVYCKNDVFHGKEEFPAGNIHQGEQASAAHTA